MKASPARYCHHAFLIALVLSLCGCAASYAQQPSPARITFSLDFPGSQPEHYVLVVDSSGHATYTSGKPSADSDSDHVFDYDFTLSEPTRARIFDLAARAHYFDGDINYKGRVASTGTKTLAYKDAQHNTQASYNYTSNQPVQQITAIFQNMSSTLELGRRLADSHQYQKLALDDELKRMEDMARENELAELQAITPILKRIVADQSVINVSRARAQRLLERAGSPAR